MNKSSKSFFTVLLFLVFFGCTSAVSSADKIDAADMSQVNIPAREHGYSNLQNAVITSATELDSFIQFIEQQPAWNKKSEFVNTLQSENIDFEDLNLILYFHTEGSGSIIVSLNKPVWEGENAVVNITRYVPDVGTADMAYYGYAFKLKKTIAKIIFAIGDKRVEILNESF